ncbi:MAG: hypothetical protein MUC86_13445 [Burkholderiaceae bacterium]|nr:hypothetical protein [Burkholderiaceae bacterium]
MRPLAFNASTHLVSTTATEPVAAWSASTTYAAGTLVLRNSAIWESVAANNLNQPPESSPLWWLEVGPTNPLAMFDTQVSTATSGTAPMQVVIAPGVAISSLALIGVAGATSVTVSVADGGDLVYDNTVEMVLNEFLNWYAWFFDEYEFRPDVVLTDLPALSTAVMTITISASSGTVAVGAALFGNMTDIGAALYGVRAGIIDYSTKQTDEYGTTTFVRRAFARRLALQTSVLNTELNTLFRVLSALRATPTVWLADEEPNASVALTVYGFFRDFTVTIPYPTHSICDLEIEGLT